jgi:uncharacterized protein YndB with AHSA1/START domain
MSDAIGDSIEIAAPAEKVWAMVSDVTRMPQWSPEQAATKWVGGANGPAVGARFRGTNRNGWRTWSTSCRVTEAEPGRRFAFRVRSYGMPVADWIYEFTPTHGGCTVHESTIDRRNFLIHHGGTLVTGIRNRSMHNLDGIRATLAAIKAAAEG